MMTSSNGNIFHVTGPLCGEFKGPGEFPTQRPVTRSFDVFFDLRLNNRLSKQPWGWWFDTSSWSLWRHCNVEKLPVYWLFHDEAKKPNTCQFVNFGAIRSYSEIIACNCELAWIIWQINSDSLTLVTDLKIQNERVTNHVYQLFSNEYKLGRTKISNERKTSIQCRWIDIMQWHSIFCLNQALC